MISKLFNSKFFSIAVVFIAGWLVLSWLGVENNKKAFDKEIMGIEAKISNVQKTNNELSEFRNSTKDVFLTPFKGLRKDGMYRRRMDYQLARNFISTHA